MITRQSEFRWAITHAVLAVLFIPMIVLGALNGFPEQIVISVLGSALQSWLAYATWKRSLTL